MDKRILLAEITSAHGIKGLVKLRYFGGDIADIKTYNPLFTSETGSQQLTIHVKNAIKNGYVAEVEGISDRNHAEELAKTKLYINKDQLPETEDGEFYYDDLIGCQAYENQSLIGKVIAVDDFGAGALLEIRPKGQPAFYLPFKDEFVGNVNIHDKKIEVTIPEGLR
tara:strand:+ start:96 stop:596 length:501 start_codon:yes stop_codon:yes gene_type:complete